MRLPVNETQIISVLRHHLEMKVSFQQQRQLLYQLHQQQEVIREEEAFFSVSKQQERQNQQRLEEECLSLAAQMEQMHRIWICYQALPPSLQAILTKLYIEQQKWDTIGISSSQISRLRRRALQQIMDWYDSDLSEMELQLEGKRLAWESLAGSSRGKEQKEK